MEERAPRCVWLEGNLWKEIHPLRQWLVSSLVVSHEVPMLELSRLGNPLTVYELK